MASLMESYEQQYSSLTADIVSKTGSIPNLAGSDKQAAVNNVEHLMDETKELLEQMELEARELPPRDRNKYQTRLHSYQSELSKLQKDLKRAKIAFSDYMHAREELLGTNDGPGSEDQRARLLDNTEQVERTGKRLEHGYRTCIETEEMGANILEDLNSQRNTIQKSRDRLRETNEALGKSSRVLSGMMKRIIQNRLLMVALGVTMVVVIGVGIYFATKKS